MDFKDVYTRERNAIVHGQSVRFRIIKYIVLVPIFFGVYIWKGALTMWYVLAVALVVSLIIHLFFRYMSDGWRKSWWLYKHKPLEE